ncbi:hypothetical protein [Dethiobacter alkaliphilus]|uniref:hypothetical protein n=1 Tax=Dethiobacter alkaliphilus TaxID=427926 RepID=UPI0022280040|nr:hypothetical protein [Dethiobacter alkaliphilus]MCW3489511.1 hypothetical protein [Dethiobacter alkaliphilus]
MNPVPPRFLVLAVLLITFFYPSQALANGMPVLWWPGSFHGPVLPADDTPIGIQSEVLDITYEKSSWDADVAVSYELLNPTDEVQHVAVLFLGDILGEGVITLNEERVTAHTGSINMDTVYPSFTDDAQFIWYDPFTLEQYQKPEDYRGYQQSITGVPFELELQPGTHLLEVRYQNPLGYDETRFPHGTHHLTYLLQPASYWQSFNNLQINVTLPSASYRLASSLPLEKTGSRTWSATFSQLPAEDLHISFINTANMWLGPYSTRGNLWFLLAILTLAVYLLSKKVHTINTKPGLIFLALLSFFTGWIVWSILTLPMLPYPFTFLQYPLLAIILIWLFAILKKAYLNNNSICT